MRHNAALALLLATSCTNADAPLRGVQLTFVAQPADAVAGVAIAPSVRVAIQDATGGTVTTAISDVTVALATGASTVGGAALRGTLTQKAVNGIATFADLAVERAAAGYTLTADAPNLTAGTSAAFTITPASPARLTLMTQPSSVSAGATLPAITVVVQDAFGNTVTNATDSITIAISSGTGSTGAILNGTLRKSPDNGVATFSDLRVDKAAAGYTLVVSAGTLPAATSAAFSVVPASPAKLAIVAQPSNATAGMAIGVVRVAVQDAFGNSVAGASNSISVAVTAGTGTSGATLGGTTTQTATNGIAEFANLTLDKAANGYTLTASAAGLASVSTAAFSVAHANASKLAFSALPTSIAAGSAIDPAVQVEAQDAFGNTAASFTGDIAVAVTSGTGVAGASLNGTATQHATAGVATFRDLTIDKAGGGYTLSAVTAGLTGATSNQFTVNVGAARRLSFVSQPNTVVAGAAISPALQVAVLDAGGNRVTTSTASVTMSVTSGSGAVGAALGGTVTQPAASGVATFDNLTIDKAASGYTLTASSSSVTGAASSSFAVMAGPASSLAILTQPATVTVRAPIAALRVVVHDAFGNAVVSPSQTVNIGIASGTGSPGAALAGPTSQNTINGEVTFTALSVDRPADGYRLTAVLPGTSMTVTSNAFNAVPPIDPNPDNVTITVADLKANRVVRFTDMSGANWQSGPTVSGRSLDLPWHISLDASGRIYVANRDIEVIVRMDDVAGDGWKTFGPTNVIANPGELLKSVNVDQSGHIYFLIESRLVRMDDMDGNGRVTANVPLYNPKTVAFDAQGRIYIADTDNHRVVRINDMSGAGFVSFGSQGSGVGQFNRPEGVAVDALGRIYLTDNENHRIVRINDMSGTGWVTFGSFGGGVGQLNEPHDIAVSAAMRIYVADAGNGRIVRIDDMTGGGWFAFGWRTVQNSSNDTCPVLPNCVLPGKYEFIAPKGIRLQP